MCLTRALSCPVSIKPGPTNVLIREKNYLQAWYMYRGICTIILLSITGTLLFHSGHFLYNFTLDTTNIICQTVMRQNIQSHVLHNIEFILNQFLQKMLAKCGFNLIYEWNTNQQQQGIALFFRATLVFESPNLVHHSWIFI